MKHPQPTTSSPLPPGVSAATLLRRLKKRDPDKRTEQCMVRLSVRERALAVRYARENDLTLSACIRRFIKEGLDRAFPPDRV